MASATSVTSVAYVPFRRFLPHERPQTAVLVHQDYHDNDYEEEAQTVAAPGLPQPMLSDEDVSVLIEAGHPENDWSRLEERVDTLYLPFAFALAANQ